MRGHQTLYTDVFPSSVTVKEESISKRNVHRDKRDEVLACRYYYHAHLMRRRYDDCLLNLEQEFHITPPAIMQRLKEKQAFVKELVAQKATAARFRKLYPFFTWSEATQLRTY